MTFGHVGRTLYGMSRHPERLEIRLESDLMVWLEMRAEKSGLSASAAVREILYESKLDFEEFLCPPSATYVYFIGTEAHVKIGWCSGEVERRRDTLQTGTVEKLNILCSAPGNRFAEASLHRIFSSFRVRGEWFTRAPPIEDLIAKINAGDVDLSHWIYEGTGSKVPAVPPAPGHALPFFPSPVLAPIAEREVHPVESGRKFNESLVDNSFFSSALAPELKKTASELLSLRLSAVFPTNWDLKHRYCNPNVHWPHLTPRAVCPFPKECPISVRL